MPKWTTADLWDQHGANLRCVDPIFRSFGKKTAFQGQITTVKLFEDNSLVRQQLATPGHGKVLVIDGGGSLRCALVGDQLATLAIQNGWEGIAVYGCIRDVAIINSLSIGIRALNTCPVKSIKKNEGDVDQPVYFASTRFRPGNFLYADEDGMLVGPDGYEDMTP